MSATPPPFPAPTSDSTTAGSLGGVQQTDGYKPAANCIQAQPDAAPQPTWSSWMPEGQPLAFVDLETTGGTAQNDRITEIGIVTVDAHGTQTWSQLLNPGMPIPPFIQRLTGITDAMVKDAPTFADVANEVLAQLQGRLFVAHNARFDYGFLQTEFARLGIAWQSEVLCTVRLSRKLYPEHSRHNLDSLIARHGLTVENRHRALDDAQLLWQFWQRIQQQHPPERIASVVRQLTGRALPGGGAAPVHLGDIPDGHGVYVLRGDADAPLLVGKGSHLRRRVAAHFKPTRQATTQALQDAVRRVEWHATAGAVSSLIRQMELVDELHPSQQPPETSAWGWRLPARPTPGAPVRPLTQADAKPMLLPARALLTQTDGASAFGWWPTEREAKRNLEAIATRNHLCQVQLGLEDAAAGQPCRARRGLAGPHAACAGACVGAESAERHLARLHVALAEHRLPAWPHPGPVALREGERWHLLDHWQHLGSAQDWVDARRLAEAGGHNVHFSMELFELLRGLLSDPVVRRERLVSIDEARALSDATPPVLDGIVQAPV